ncbi:ScyD/ScyE family protein [Blastococcus sp. SYSU D00695]
MRRWKGAAVAATTLALVVPATAASATGGGGGAADDAVEPVAEGLQGPRQIDAYYEGHLLVAESDSAEISAVHLHDGRVETVATLGAPGTVNPQGVGYEPGTIVVALGETGGGPEEGPPPPISLPPEGTPLPTCQDTGGLPPGPGLVALDAYGVPVWSCDLLLYELLVNPDGQSQVDEQSVPVDSLSNPYAVLVEHDRVFVADAGANAVLSVDRATGEISTFFVPPLVTTGACEGAENNPAAPGYEATVGCDPVPTGVVRGPDGLLYVSTLGALTPGAGRVYVLDDWGNEVGRIEDLNPMTGIAVGHHGTVYVSELSGDTPAFPPPTEPVGRVVRITPDGERTYAPVLLPQGLEILDGSLYAAAGSLIPDGGSIVRVGEGAFAAA